MEAVLKFIVKYVDINVLALFLIASIFLLYIDAKGYKKSGLNREYRMSRVFGYIYIVLGIVLFAIARYVRV